jgi:CheY-like chemotaxis protein
LSGKEETVEHNSKRSKPQPQGDKGQSRVVLVVDDDTTLCRFIADALEPEGYSIVRAADGRRALAAVEDANPDLILLDVNMPGIDGWKVLSELRAKAGPHRSIVVMTGQYEGQERALQSGAQGYLAKPFDLDDLLESVDLHSRIIIESNYTERLATREGGSQP